MERTMIGDVEETVHQMNMKLLSDEVLNYLVRSIYNGSLLQKELIHNLRDLIKGTII